MRSFYCQLRQFSGVIICSLSFVVSVFLLNVFVACRIVYLPLLVVHLAALTVSFGRLLDLLVIPKICSRFCLLCVVSLASVSQRTLNIGLQHLLCSALLVMSRPTCAFS